MKLSRRQWLAGAGTAAAGLALTRLQAMADETRKSGMKFGMCDWSIGRDDPGVFDVAKQIGLDGVEVSIGYPKDGLQLRRAEVQKAYMEAAHRTGLSIPSTAMGVLNDVPLVSEPKAALWVADGIEATARLGAKSMLLAFFGKGELKEDAKEDLRRVTEALVELAPRAEKAGVILGFESYLSARTLIGILDQVKSPALQVYYDIYNNAHVKHDPLEEMRLLGRNKICQIHFKDYPMLEKGSGKVDWPATVRVLREIKYDGWIVLETGSPNKDIVADTKKNLAYVKGLFA
ncbi:MAG TPA: sugar phosphate isomerase/epimerase family protein [Phycisphaerae bacterium]|nr:sugar phosphate isomerase/epimerase family protein [Phycisphaerae bacterium]HRR84766.1 sugar phosphate isomerase/epimerase family protein [Phycisphaerae bacterium]